MLSENVQATGETDFRDTELFKKCQELGIIPKTAKELREKTAGQVDEEHERADDAGNRLLIDLNISGMWCPACAWVIEEAIRKKPGVHDVSCRFSTDRFRCRYDPVKTSPAAIFKLIESLGYRASYLRDEPADINGQGEWIRLAVSASLTMNVMMFSFALYVGFFDEFSKDTVYRLSFPIFAMSSVVVFYGGIEIFKKAMGGLSVSAFGVETLTAIGSLTAYGYSTYHFFLGNIHVYFDTASMLITLVLIGKMMENRARRRIHKDLNLFFSLMPNKVRILSDAYPDGRYAPVGRLKKGDGFRVSEGEIVPADGIVVSGTIVADESSLTGEAKPVQKDVYDHLKSGSRVVSGACSVRAEAVGKEAVLGRMIQVMEDAISRKDPFERKTDRVLRWFVPAIVGLSVITGMVWILAGLSPEKAFIRGICVLVISCPCSLGIAVPLAQAAGISLGIKKGILIRDLSGMEKSGRIAVYLFDKTGTLTEGKWRLIRVATAGGFSEKKAIALAAGLEGSSDHYIAAEIRAYAKACRIEPASISEIQVFENGISGFFQGIPVKIGSAEFLKDEFITSGEVDVGNESRGEALGEAEQSRIYMSYDGKPCASLVFSDRLKKGSVDAVDRLRRKGYRLALVSGDSACATARIAEKVGIKDAYGGKLPLEKAELVRQLREKSGSVAMVGDGINDAPAMVCADLAVAMHSGNDLGKQAAHVTLMGDDPGQLLDFIDIAGRVEKKVYQNLSWAFFYNAAGIPIAASGLLTPVIAVCAMLLSSLSVIGNTLLLVWGKPKGEKEKKHGKRGMRWKRIKRTIR